MDLVSGYQKSRIVLTAYELDLFTALGDGKKVAGEVAKVIKSDPRATERLMNALCAIKLLEKEGNYFSNGPLASRFLVKGKPEFMANLLHSVNQWKSWSTLTEAVRCGTSVTKSRSGNRNKQWVQAFISAMHWRGGLRTSELADELDLSGASRILDVGGGSGIYAMEMVRRKDGAEAVVFDLPDVVPLAQFYINEAGLAHRMTVQIGDYETDDFGSGFDLVLFSAIIHINSPKSNQRLMQKAWSALNPGGQVVVSDFIMNEDRIHPTRGAIFSINMLVATQSGDTYTESEVRTWMETAGFARLDRRDTASGPSLIIGWKTSE
jgi:2-polyprenyl-3-methyl-5-hydroxy-6-metoxy-1,4-benzoquinol methylase